MEKLRKTALIVGASSGIGYATAMELVQDGYEVFNISRTFSDIKGISNHLADVANEEGFMEAVDDVLKLSKGQIDVAIYSAGYSMATPCEIMDMEKCRYMFEVNFFGAVQFAKRVIPSMRENGFGRIILIGSLAGRLPIPYLTFYTATKSALESFNEGLSQEIKPLGLHSTLVMPGGTRTSFSYSRDIEDTANTCYDKACSCSTENLKKDEQEGMETTEVAKIIVGTLKKKNPPLTIATGFKNILTGVGAKLMPKKTLNKIVKTKFEG
ncbi:MAG: SDR family NAD(P)-dependent oxidoreductase [Firmicutes bacterium]|nr:SDR family NAD(P)-dependent oxidoreductase [Bacillota bacterium]MCL2255678.1 SDR family NAD(P)-dependent oxidoreductase [Bacillota bacterium]